jgi:hypothetical protein
MDAVAVLPVGGSKVAQASYGLIVKEETGALIEAGSGARRIGADFGIGDFDNTR